MGAPLWALGHCLGLHLGKPLPVAYCLPFHGTLCPAVHLLSYLKGPQQLCLLCPQQPDPERHISSNTATEVTCARHSYVGNLDPKVSQGVQGVDSKRTWQSKENCWAQHIALRLSARLGMQGSESDSSYQK